MDNTIKEQLERIDNMILKQMAVDLTTGRFYEEVEKMTIFRRYELFGCLEAKDVMPSLLKKSEKK